MTVAEVGQMSASEWEGWKAYFALEGQKAERRRLEAQASAGARGRTAGMRRRR